MIQEQWLDFNFAVSLKMVDPQGSSAKYSLSVQGVPFYSVFQVSVWWTNVYGEAGGICCEKSQIFFFLHLI